jgi:hypothetical protein
MSLNIRLSAWTIVRRPGEPVIRETETCTLPVVADRRRGQLPLQRIGSAANHVGYHIAAHAALHRWFIEENRPVPRFLFLDQPEQAYFPEHVSADSQDPSTEIADEDWDKVHVIYSFLRDLTIEQDGKLQIIVVGHARHEDVDWFSDVLVEDWKTDGSGLVTERWIDEQTGDTPESD